ncbi:(2Fe-2S)-binding protein [bacterium]|nr:(2Fe-2S)-binding protein [bacterium]MBU4601904.1 (2Fe-2S)-binding protein [bacterium]MCG2762437.1 (2Fe-2S)-binding protein [Candidatus Atribacteria bacterium]MCG2821621.1 (2Fe-2S)-binding protein [Candidatus Atribacteria bacterium]MDP2945731.1 (2Fe-2S)-binding protein [Atribacterota bacterium]
MKDETIICRCEDITWGEIRQALEKGYTTFDEIKRITRAGMGRCQGTTCLWIILKEIAKFYHKKIEEVAVPTFRPPTKPVKLGTLAGDDGD